MEVREINKNPNSENSTWRSEYGKGAASGLGSGALVGAVRLTSKVQIFENRMTREWLSTEEAAYFLSVTSNALRIMVHRDQISAYKFGRRLRFNVRDCRALFEKKGH